MLVRMPSRNSADCECSRGARASASIWGLAKSSAIPISSASTPKAQALPRTIPRPRATDCPTSITGATSSRYASPCPGPSTAASSAAALSVARAEAIAPARRRATSNGKGAISAKGSSRGRRTNDPNMRAENTPAPRAPLVRGSRLSRTRAVSELSGTFVPEPAPGAAQTGRPGAPAPRSVRREGQERDVARPLDGERELALVLGAGAEHPPGQDLAPLGHEPREQLHVLVVDVVDLVRAELADLPPAEQVALARVLAAASARRAAP